MSLDSPGESPPRADWDPAAYARFAELRRRPADDLLTRVPLARAGRIVDLGCGDGGLAPVLAARWPGAAIVGVDASPAMLSAARERAAPGAAALTWVEADIADWTPDGPVDLIVSNAVLHMLDGHDRLLPRLMDQLVPGGVLAVQMPRNFDRPSHALMRAVAAEGPWAGRLAVRTEPVARPEATYGMLAPHAARLDVWETDYLHVLDGPDAVFRWVEGTTLVPVRTALDAASLDAFATAYRRRLAEAYPPGADGRTLYAFRRQFIVAVAPA